MATLWSNTSSRSPTICSRLKRVHFTRLCRGCCVRVGSNRRSARPRRGVPPVSTGSPMRVFGTWSRKSSASKRCSPESRACWPSPEPRRTIMQTLRKLFSRRRRYEDLSVSIQEHIEERAEELMDEGMARKQAEQAARREFGNVALIQQRSREVWHWPALESILADLDLTFRRLKKSPGFAATVLLTMALGIGANTAVFSVLNSVLLKPLPYPHSEKLVALTLNAPGAGGMTDISSGLQLSPSMYLTFSGRNRTFQSLGVWTPSTANITGVAHPEEVHTTMISDGVLEALGVLPCAGRLFSQADQDPRGAKTAMLS